MKSCEIVDKIAKIRAKKAELASAEKTYTEMLKAIGTGTYYGKDHILVISEVERSTLDMNAVKEKLSRQFITANTKVTSFLTTKLFGYPKKEAA